MYNDFPYVFIIQGDILKKSSSFLFSTFILAVVNFIVRCLGFIYRIILSRLIGAEAIGLYQMVFPFLMVVITITTAGIPIAVSKMIAKENSVNNRNGVYKVLAIALFLGGAISVLLSILVSVELKFITNNILKNPKLYYPLVWSVPAISVITLSSIMRGFFYGLKDIKPAANAQIIEQVFRIVFVLSYLYYVRPTDPVSAANIAIIGVTLGELGSLLFLIFKFNFKKLTSRSTIVKFYKTPSIHILNDLLFISVPITLSRLIAVGMQSANSILIPQRLEISGISAIESVEIFGKISGMAMPLLFLPFTVTTALVLNIIPNISEQLAVNNISDVKYKSGLAMKVTMLVAIPTTIVLVMFGDHLGYLIYNNGDVGKYLSIISYATIFMCIQHTSSGILHGMGKQVITSVNYLLGMLIQLYCTYFLIANPKYGINGFFIGFIISTCLIAVLNMITLRKHLKLNLPILQTYIKPLLCSTIMIALMILIYKAMYSVTNRNSWSTLVSCAIGCLTYVISLDLTNTLKIKPFVESLRS
ncbi:stage V sporulation protein B [Serpentinicella alkaliphila]|nr:stage V sporulation protein B [Serpentinicella alkaliphila]QUH27368.1 stage V sporulation protein B [Serpentinicella alkaliphila]